ncbi:MAG: EF-hand domain-containing protein [Thiogranum sp.]|nr:EF-hand domain-containing protein [Thiogranum sp.]
MKHSLTSLAAAVAMVVAVSSVLAQDEPMPPAGPVPFATLDQDGDGYINQKEFTHMRDERVRMRTEAGRMMRNMGNAPEFGDIDGDGDGRVSQQEYQQHQQMRMEQRMQQGGMGPGGGMGPTGGTGGPHGGGMGPGGGMGGMGGGRQ